MDDPIWLHPASITHKVGGSAKLTGLASGDWDLQAAPFEETVKFKAIEAHFLHGVPWRETDLFTDVYTRRLAQDGHIRGMRSLNELLNWFAPRIERIAQSLRQDGFILEANGRHHPLPSLLIGRSGQVYIGNQGNHRLALAQVLGLERFAGRITCKHSHLSPR